MGTRLLEFGGIRLMINQSVSAFLHLFEVFTHGTKVGKVTKAKTRTKTTTRNNVGHIAFFTAKAQGTAPKIVRRQRRHRKE